MHCVRLGSSFSVVFLCVPLSSDVSIAQLTVLSNLETHNAEMIKQGIDKAERFDRLKQIAEYQLRVLTEAEAIQKLPKGNDQE